MYRFVLACLMLFVLTGCGGAAPQVSARLGAVEAVNANDSTGFAKVTAPRPFVFPQDHGPHPEFQTEWWYYTGNLDSADGRHFGFQLTFFRRALEANPPQRSSDLATRNIYMAHFAVSDVAGNQFYAFDRFSRDGGGLAGASGEPFHVWLEDWNASGSGPQGNQMQLKAAQDAVALELNLDSSKPPTLQGDQGLSQKGQASGNASLYYSLTRMQTTGSVTIKGQRYDVTGLTWMDREFGTSALDPGLVGWDWFSLQLADGCDVMFYNLRQDNGDASPFSKGSIVAQDGTTRTLARDDVQIEVLATWTSPRSNAVYPARWRLTLPKEQLVLEITPYLADQELPLTVTYWEGAVRITGTSNGQPLAGNGYVELTGYTADRPARY